MAITATMPAPPELVCEYKQTAHIHSLSWVQTLLAHHLLPDPKYPTGIVESVYFDDEWASSYSEKADGDYYKRKIRIRWYPGSPVHPDGTQPVFLEIKDRRGSTRNKAHLAFSADAAQLQHCPLADPWWGKLLADMRPSAGRILPVGLTPSISIRYHRNRYILPGSGARFALDWQLESPRCNALRFLRNLPVADSTVVFEAKSSLRRDWPWSEALRQIGFAPCSFSKYGVFMKQRIEGGMT